MSQFPRDGHQNWQARRRQLAERVRTPTLDTWSIQASMDEAIGRSRDYLGLRQAADGHWVGAVESDLLPACEYFLLQDLLGHQPTNSALMDALATHQLPEGGWARTANGPFDLDLSVTAYMALKAARQDSLLDRTRTAVLAHGGADQAGALTRWRMAAMGHVGFDKCFSLPVESLLLPRWVPGNLFSWGGWSRPVLVALAILSAVRPTRTLSDLHAIDELFARAPEQWPAHPLLKADAAPWLAGRIAQHGHALAGSYHKRPVAALRERALARGEQYLLEHIPNRPGWSPHAAWPFWCTLALMSRGHCQQSDAVRCCLDELHWLHDHRTANDRSPAPAGDPAERSLASPEHVAQRSCLASQVTVTPVRDTALSLRALTLAGCPTQETTARRAIDWLLAKESTEPGDWVQTVDVDAGGWSATYRDCLFPDADTTATVLLALREQFASRPPETVVADDSMVAMIRANSLDLARHQIAVLDRVAAASRRARRWLLALQNRDGGWARFDKDHSSRWLSSLQIAHDLPSSDPSCSEVTGRVLESLGRWEMRRGRSAVDRGVAMLRRAQRPAGNWRTCRQDASLRATCQVLIGYAAIGVSVEDPSVVAATNWLIDQQLEVGAWSPTPADPTPANPTPANPTRADPTRADRLLADRLGPASERRVPSVVLTAWALLGLQITGSKHREVVRRGIEFLVSAQRHDGTWTDSEYLADDGTGLARWRRELDSICLPLMALGYWANR